jgi:hypothetical protein
MEDYKKVDYLLQANSRGMWICGQGYAELRWNW